MHVCACGRQREREGQRGGNGGVDGPLECKRRDIPAIKYSSAENRSLEGMVVI